MIKTIFALIGGLALIIAGSGYVENYIAMDAMQHGLNGHHLWEYQLGLVKDND